MKRAIAVYSPVTGVVMERTAYHHGTFVDPSKDLFTIVDLSRVWVLGEVYEIDLPFIRTGQAAEIELPYSGGGRKSAAVSISFTRSSIPRAELHRSAWSFRIQAFRSSQRCLRTSAWRCPLGVEYSFHRTR